MITNNMLKDILLQVIDKFYNNDLDSKLVKLKGTEQACVFRIGLYINQIISTQNCFKNYTLDCEYNKNLNLSKYLEDKYIRPDLILHKRFQSGTNANLMVIEFKGWWNSNTKDLEKLKKLQSDPNYKYQFAAWVKLGKDKNTLKVKFLE